jgi:hypothetical protein
LGINFGLVAGLVEGALCHAVMAVAGLPTVLTDCTAICDDDRHTVS